MTPILPITPRQATTTGTVAAALCVVAAGLVLASAVPPPPPDPGPLVTGSVGATGCPGSRVGSTGGPLGGSRTTTTKDGTP